MPKAERNELEIHYDVDRMTIVYRWPRDASATGLMGGALCLAAAVFALQVSHRVPLALFFALAGGWLLYFGLKLLMNKTTILAEAGQVSVSSGPIFVGPPRVFGTQGILEFFVARPVVGRRPIVEPSPTIFLTDSQKIPHRLIDAVPSKDLAARIRTALLEFYGLEDLEEGGPDKANEPT